MRLLVAAGRHFDDAACARRALDLIHAGAPVTVVIHGGHPVLGTLAEDWARTLDLHVVRYPANWRLHGKRAEGIRNAFMLEDSRPDLVLALPGGRTLAALVRAAASRGLPVRDFSALPHPATSAARPPEPEPGPAMPAPALPHAGRIAAPA